ncbi:hypothetical protein STCU_10787 [Strigomonas culicis]|uniref:Uncharacterized protein n=1 Tax=Strigomonas culicis TaxID=28005 RepID=S9URG6_9TRYP|nr:hypothetical protein STCU_10787 [Strigomonas culicis]|eukprot:EPY17171.1 hypothetical protein STCU_10787 [Strigomonas culicis]
MPAVDTDTAAIQRQVAEGLRQELHALGRQIQQVTGSVSTERDAMRLLTEELHGLDQQCLQLELRQVDLRATLDRKSTVKKGKSSPLQSRVTENASLCPSTEGLAASLSVLGTEDKAPTGMTEELFLLRRMQAENEKLAQRLLVEDAQHDANTGSHSLSEKIKRHRDGNKITEARMDAYGTKRKVDLLRYKLFVATKHPDAPPNVGDHGRIPCADTAEKDERELKAIRYALLKRLEEYKQAKKEEERLTQTVNSYGDNS